MCFAREIRIIFRRNQTLFARRQLKKHILCAIICLWFPRCSISHMQERNSPIMFNEKYATGLEMFSATHFIVIAVCIALLVCTIVFRKHFASPRADKAFRYTLGSLLLVFETVFHIWTAVSCGYSWDMFPPFGLCAITICLPL